MEPEIGSNQMGFRWPWSKETPAAPSKAELEEASAPIRTRAEVEQLRKRIAVVARVFSDAHDLELLPMPGVWAVSVSQETQKHVHDYFYGDRETLDDLPEDSFRFRTMYYDEDTLYKCENEDEIFGIVRHEIGHIHHSKSKLTFDSQKRAIKDGNLPTTYHFLYNALEDVWINLKESADSEIAKRQIEACHYKHVPRIQKQINNMPLNVQLGMNILHYWLEGKSIPTIRDKRVIDTFKEIEPQVNEYFWGATAESNAQLLWEKIWPAARVLEEKNIQDEMREEVRRQLSKGRQGKGGKQGQQSQSGQGQPGQSQQGGQGQSGQRQPPPQGQGQGQGQPQSGQSSGAPQGAPQQGGGGGGAMQRMKDAIKNFGKGSKNSQGDKQDLSEQLKKHGGSELMDKLDRQQEERQNQEQGGGGENQELTPEMIKEMEDYINSLPPDLKKELERRAREELDRKQAEALKDELPSGMEVKEGEDGKPRTVQFRDAPSKKEEKQARKKKEQQLKEAAKDAAREKAAQDAESSEDQDGDPNESQEQQSARDQRKRQMEKDGFGRSEGALFDEFKQLEREIQPVTAKFIRVLEKIVPKHLDRHYEGDRYNAQRLNREVLPRRIPVNDPRIYFDSEWVESDRARLYLGVMVDCSPSMSGDKMEAARKAAVCFGKLSQQFDMPYAIKIFSSDHKNLLSFGQSYEDRKLRVKPELLYATKNLNGGTNIGRPLEELYGELQEGRKKFPESAGVAFIITDSGANEGKTGEQLQQLVGKMQKDFVVVNFLLSGSAWEIQDSAQYFGSQNTISVKNFEELPDEAGRVLCKVFEQHIRRFRKE